MPDLIALQEVDHLEAFQESLHRLGCAYYSTVENVAKALRTTQIYRLLPDWKFIINVSQVFK